MQSKKEVKNKIKHLEDLLQTDGFLSDYNQGLLDGFKWVLQLLHPLMYHAQGKVVQAILTDASYRFEAKLKELKKIKGYD